MEIRLPSALLPAQTGTKGIAKLLEQLRPGQNITAVIESKLAENSFLLRLADSGQRLRAHSRLDLTAGQTLKLEVVKLGTTPELKIVPPARTDVPDTVAIQQALRQYLPKQQNLAELVPLLQQTLNQQAAKSAQNLPESLRTLIKTVLDALPQKKTLFTAEGLRLAARNSGVFFEAELAARSTPVPQLAGRDLKSRLLALNEALKSLVVADHGNRAVPEHEGPRILTTSPPPAPLPEGEEDPGVRAATFTVTGDDEAAPPPPAAEEPPHAGENTSRPKPPMADQPASTKTSARPGIISPEAGSGETASSKTAIDARSPSSRSGSPAPEQQKSAAPRPAADREAPRPASSPRTGSAPGQPLGDAASPGPRSAGRTETGTQDTEEMANPHSPNRPAEQAGPRQPAAQAPNATGPLATDRNLPTPHIAKPAISQPATTEPGADHAPAMDQQSPEPNGGRPATVQPATVQPATVQPATAQPATAQPAAAEAGSKPPTSEQKGSAAPADESSSGHTLADESATVKMPALDQDRAGQPGEKPSARPAEAGETAAKKSPPETGGANAEKPAEKSVTGGPAHPTGPRAASLAQLLARTGAPELAKTAPGAPLPAADEEMPPTSPAIVHDRDIMPALARQPAPPVAPDRPQESSARQDATPLPDSPETMASLKSLQQHTEGALARIVLDQLASLPQADGKQLIWQMEIPFTGDRHADSAKLKIVRDEASSAQAGQAYWSVILELNPPGLGTIHSRITLCGERVDTYFWSDLDSTFALIRDNLDLLAARLQQAGLQLGQLNTLPGTPTGDGTASVTPAKLVDERA